MQRTRTFLASALGAGLLLSATAAQASPVYRVTLAEASAERTPIIRNSPWICEGESCATNRATSRPEHVCVSVARELGRIVSFSVDDAPLGEEELARCNESAQ